MSERRERVPLVETRRERVPLVWSPEWEGVICQWTKKFINANLWRCDRIHTFDDLLQDSYLIYMKLCKRYPRVVEQRHFMALYKTALTNQFHDKAIYMKRKRVVHQDTSADVSDLYVGRIGEVSNNGYIAALLDEAPDELKIALKLLTEQPELLRDQQKPRRGEPRLNLNMKLRKLLDLPPEYDFVKSLRSLLSA